MNIVLILGRGRRRKREVSAAIPPRADLDPDLKGTVCPRSLDPLYMSTYCINWVKTPLTFGMCIPFYYVYFLLIFKHIQ